MYLAVSLNLRSGRVIGWIVRNRMKRDLSSGRRFGKAKSAKRRATRALKMATALRAPPKSCTHHTDRGSQDCWHGTESSRANTAPSYPLLCMQTCTAGQWMSGKGNCFENAAVETFFETTKAKMIWRRAWETRRQVGSANFEYINNFYNLRRRHSALGLKSTVAFERKVA